MYAPRFGSQRLQDHTSSALSGAVARRGGCLCCWADLPLPGSDAVEAMPLVPRPHVVLPRVEQKSFATMFPMMSDSVFVFLV